VAVTGVGKSADVGQKVVGTLNSTGTRAYMLDATRALHGDLGMVHPDDVALARASDAAVVYGPVTEACPLALAPSTSTTVMLALGDALAFALLEERQFTAEDF